MTKSEPKVGVEFGQLQNEIERLTKDKTVLGQQILQVEASIANYQDELRKLKSQDDMVAGALQTCNYFLTQFDNTEEKESK